MSAYRKKRKVATEFRVFTQTWTSKYLFTEDKGKAVCLVSGEQVAVLKDYNLNRHYKTIDTEKCNNLTEAERARTSEALLTKLHKQQGFFYQALHIQGCSSQDQLCDITQNRQKQ